MVKDEDTRVGDIERRIGRQVKLPKTGIITEVHEHQSEDDQWNFHVDVRIDEETNPRKVPVATPIPDLAAPPRSDDHPDGPDLALVQYLEDDETNRPIVTHILYNNEDRPPRGKEGMVRIRRGSLYAELAEDGSYARLAQKTESDGTPGIVIEIDDTGTVSLGNPGGDLQPIARKGDSVEVELSDGSTGTGTITEGSSDVQST